MITILLFVVMYAAGMIVFNDKGFAKPHVPESVHFQCRSSGYRDGRNDRYASQSESISQLVLLQHLYVWLPQTTENHGAALYRTSYGTGDRTSFCLIQGFLVSYLEIQPFIVTLAGMFF